jgi:hypothetical protein
VKARRGHIMGLCVYVSAPTTVLPHFCLF